MVATASRTILPIREKGFLQWREDLVAFRNNDSWQAYDSRPGHQKLRAGLSKPGRFSASNKRPSGVVPVPFLLIVRKFTVVHVLSPESVSWHGRRRHPQHLRNLQPGYSRLTFFGIRLGAVV